MDIEEARFMIEQALLPALDRKLNTHPYDTPKPHSHVCWNGKTVREALPFFIRHMAIDVYLNYTDPKRKGIGLNGITFETDYIFNTLERFAISYEHSVNKLVARDCLYLLQGQETAFVADSATPPSQRLFSTKQLIEWRLFG